MTSNQYHQVAGKSPNVSPQKRLGKSDYIPMTNPLQSITKSEGKEVMLSMEWFQQLDFGKNKQKSVQKLESLYNYIQSRGDSTVTLFVSFDAFGITDQKSYYQTKASTNLKHTLQKLRNINHKLTLGEIRQQQAKQKNARRQLKKLKFFKFSFLNWLFPPQQELRIIRKIIYTQRISISLAGTSITDNLLQQLCKLLTNTIGLYEQIELNLQNCKNVNYLMLKKLMNVTIQHFPQVLKFRFVGWGSDLKKYFLTQDKIKQQQLIQQSKKEIADLRQKMKFGRFDVLLDFRNWHEDFDLKKQQQQTNADKGNEQSYGLYSMSKGINKPKYNLVFLA